MLQIAQTLRQHVDKVERELARLHPETITPVEWIMLRVGVFAILETNRDILRAVEDSNRQEQELRDLLDEYKQLVATLQAENRELRKQWQQPSVMSWFGSILSRRRPR